MYEGKVIKSKLAGIISSGCTSINLFTYGAVDKTKHKELKAGLQKFINQEIKHLEENSETASISDAKEIFESFLIALRDVGFKFPVDMPALYANAYFARIMEKLDNKPSSIKKIFEILKERTEYLKKTDDYQWIN